VAIGGNDQGTRVRQAGSPDERGADEQQSNAGDAQNQPPAFHGQFRGAQHLRDRIEFWAFSEIAVKEAGNWGRSSRLLEQARSYGDVLVVGVKSDSTVSVENAKAGANGSGTNFAPQITPLAERAEILSELAAVDYVVECEGESADSLVMRLRPEILVESGSANVNAALGLHAKPEGEGGIKIIRILREPGYSTEQLLARITQSPRSPA
jgi:glycerol-3-phosphate cytidylyltransferase-like family protein